MMNISELLTSIKMDLGIYGLALPFENPDQTLYDVIKLKSIKFFSPYQPQVMKFTLDLTTIRCLKSQYNESIYEIPQGIFGDRRLLYVRKVDPRNKLLGNGYVNPTYDDSIDNFNTMMMTQANANLVSVAAPPITFKYQKPGLLYLYNMATMYGEIDIEVALEHAPNLSTIDDMAFESFYDLATLDIKAFLYNTLKHYTEIQTAYGTISLKIDDWSGAESDRKDLLNGWKDLYHLDTEQFFII